MKLSDAEAAVGETSRSVPQVPHGAPSRSHSVSALAEGSGQEAGVTGPRLRVRILTRSEELERLAPEWSRLWEEDLSSTPFQSPEWLIPWWRHLGQSELRLVAIYHLAPGPPAEQLVGVIPLYRWTEPETSRKKLLPVGIASSDYLDGLFAPGFADAALPAALSALTRQDPGWSLLEFPNLRGSSALLRWRAPPGCRCETTESEPALVLGLAGGACLSTVLAPHMLQKVGYYRRRAEKEGPISFVSGTEENAAVMLEDLFRLHRARWEQRNESGVLADPRIQQMHREALPGLLARGWLRLYALRLHGRSAALFYGFGDTREGCQRAFYYLGGMDPALARLSPGTLLVAHAVEEALREGARQFDFLRGQERYKSFWGAVGQPTWQLRLWRGE